MRYPIHPASDHYNPINQTFYVTPSQQPVQGGIQTVLRWLKAMTLDAKHYAPPAPLPSQAPDWATFLQDDQPRLIWFGHSSVFIRIAGKTLLLDPVFSQYASPIPLISRRYQAPPASLSQLPPVDYILYSHNHYDHLDKITVQHHRHSPTQFIVPLNLGMLLQKWGIPPARIIELDWWQHTAIGSLKIHAVPARHNSSRGWRDFNKTLWAGYIIQTPQHTIYFSGDSSYGSHYRQIGQRFPKIDLALVENGQYNANWRDNHMHPEETAQAAADLHAHRFMPIHWGMFSLAMHPWSESVRRSLPLIRAQNIATLTPTLGQVFTLNSQTSDWWEHVK